MTTAKNSTAVGIARAHIHAWSNHDWGRTRELLAPGPAVRRYLLAGLLTCGRCGRRLESAWSNGRPAYRCRHGYCSATAPDPARPKTAYVREDQIVPHLAALSILLADGGTPAPARRPGITGPARPAGLIDQLRATGTVLTYDPDNQTLRADGRDALAVTIAKKH